MTVVALARHDDIGRAIEEALQSFELGPLLAGRVVAVKPNETWASANE
ncbi:MAG TPA: hypothetical protein VFS39_10405 [Nitrospira sp.]|nr:hypothetical protein [Nitrospira sp.]